MNIEQLQEILPQRFPFLLIDRVVELEPGKKVKAVKNVSMNEEFFSGHFPSNPIMPGVLIIEAMAQAAIVLFSSAKTQAKDKKMRYYLGSVKVRFFHPVTPGDQLYITVEPVKMLSQMAIVSVKAEVSGKEVSSGELALSAKEA
ncbi:MAG: 3-hydroxyacyl-ACP dehydratase FabZ [Candidatus Omnitrophica bacterium]|jgi:beta-hydroxyacyl-ACP dehydratase FabZ|nr:3-hydroxyacyl-ACP dehydratase FabZ [Candidatus Omnitrophota bacterium]